MRKQITLSEYRAGDITIFTVLMIVVEFLAIKGIVWFSEIYAISLFLALILIVMRRWKLWAIVPMLASAITVCAVNKAEFYVYVIHIIGNLFVLLAMIWFKIAKNNFKEGHYLILYSLSAYVLMCFGKSFIGFLYGEKFTTLFIGFLGVNALNVVIAIIVLFIVRKLDGVFEDQIEYLKRVQEEKTDDSYFEV